MKKIILASLLSVLFLPLIASASLNTNLYYGLQQNINVKQLQQFLISKGFLTGNATGNFFSLTAKAVKTYQGSVGISATGYVGALTRKAINSELAIGNGNDSQVSTSQTNQSSGTNNSGALSQLQAKIKALQQQIVQNNTPIPSTVSTPMPTVSPNASPTDYSTYTPVSFELYSSNVGAYLGKSISTIGMVNSFLPQGGSGGNTNFIEIINPFDPSQPKIMLEVDDSSTYTAAVNSLQDKSSPIYQFIQVYGTGVPSTPFTMTSLLGSSKVLVPTISVTRIDKCLHGSMNTTVLTGSSLSDSFQCTAWVTVAP